MIIFPTQNTWIIESRPKKIPWLRKYSRDKGSLAHKISFVQYIVCTALPSNDDNVCCYFLISVECWKCDKMQSAICTYISTQKKWSSGYRTSIIHVYSFKRNKMKDSRKLLHFDDAKTNKQKISMQSLKDLLNFGFSRLYKMDSKKRPTKVAEKSFLFWKSSSSSFWMNGKCIFGICLLKTIWYFGRFSKCLETLLSKMENDEWMRGNKNKQEMGN